jgi:hypothetical protein
MTNGKTEGSGAGSREDLDYIIGQVDNFDKLGGVLENWSPKEGRQRVAMDAEEKLRQIAYSYGVSTGAINPEDSSTSKDNLSTSNVQKYASGAQNDMIYQAKTRLDQNFDNIIDEQIPNATLEQLATDKKFRESADEVDSNTMNAYLSFQSLAEFAMRYENNQEIRNDTEARLEKAAQKRGEELALNEVAKEATQREEQRQNAQGYKGIDKRLVRFRVGLALEATQEGTLNIQDKLKEKTIEGIREIAEEARQVYEGLDGDVYAAVRNTLKKYGKSDNTGEFNEIFDRLYNADRVAA